MTEPNDDQPAAVASPNDAATPSPTAPQPDEATALPGVVESLTIDELAAVTRVPSRTIRYYHAKGLLPAATIRGRVAYYGVAHRDRLGLIAQLQDRGLKIDAIRELVRRIDKGEVNVNEWLGLQAQMKTPWAHDQPRTFTEPELTEFIGYSRAGLLSDLIRLQLMERRGEVFLVPSPALLLAATQLEAAGVDLDATVGAERLLRRHIARAVQEVVNHIFVQAERGHIRPTGESQAILDDLRPIALEGVRIVFGQEMERVLRERAETGKVLPRMPRR